METRDRLAGEQARLAELHPPLWRPSGEGLVIGGVFVAFARGEQGPGHAGDRAFVGASATSDTRELVAVVVEGRAPAPYWPGFLAAREGPLLEAATNALLAEVDLDVLLVDATGRDHPRRAGLALQLGAVLDLPTVGVTHRPLVARGTRPEDRAGATSDLVLEGEVVGRWVRTRQGTRPVVVHPAWRTDVDTAVEVVLAATGDFRTPEPLRLARRTAREARSEHEAGPPVRRDQSCPS